MFTYRFAAIQRTDLSNTIHFVSIVADAEKEARQYFSKDFILFFTARIRINGGVA